MITHFIRAALLVLAASLAPIAHAQAPWPSRTITIILPFPAGGPSDTLARGLAAHLTQALGQPVVVENRSGATGTIGSAAAMRAPADGYTLLIASTSSHITAPAAMPRRPYDADKDFTPISIMVRYPFFLVAGPHVKANSVGELLAQARANPGRLSYGSIGVGAGNHLVGEYFKKETGIFAVHIPYRGAAATTQALLTGEIDYVFDSIFSIGTQVSAGRIKGLAISSKTRSKLFPNVPTLQEAGVKGFDEAIWIGLMAPKGLPQPIVDRLNSETVRYMRSAEVVDRMDKQGTEIVASSPSEFASVIRADLARWSAFVQERGIRIEP